MTDGAKPGILRWLWSFGGAVVICYVPILFSLESLVSENNSMTGIYLIFLY